MPFLDAVLDENEGFLLTDEGDILTRDFFDTAIKMSLFEERRANASEVPESHRRRGWLGNESTPGFENGSKLWLHEQDRITRSLFNEIETKAVNGLQWLIDDEIATSVEASASLSGGSVSLEIVITRPNSKVEKRYFDLWENTGN